MARSESMDEGGREGGPGVGVGVGWGGIVQLRWKRLAKVGKGEGGSNIAQNWYKPTHSIRYESIGHKKSKIPKIILFSQLNHI